MTLEGIQCPKCGSPVQVTRGTRLAECEYCGCTLRVTRGASGHPLGVLDTIKDDTSLIAKQQALAVLQQREARLCEERARLEEEHAARLYRAETGPVYYALRDDAWQALSPCRQGRDGVPQEVWWMVLLVVATFAASFALYEVASWAAVVMGLPAGQACRWRRSPLSGVVNRLDQRLDALVRQKAEEQIKEPRGFARSSTN